MTHVRIVFVEHGVEDEVWFETNMDWFCDKELEHDFFLEHPTAEILQVNQLD